MPPNLFVVSCSPSGYYKIFDRMLDALEYAVQRNGLVFQYSIQPSVNIKLRINEPKKGNNKK